MAQLDPESREEFRAMLKRAHKAGEGGSNDEEIDALWDIAAFACAAFNIYRDDEEGRYE